MFETAEVVAEVSFFSKLTNLYCYFSVLSINFWLLFIWLIILLPFSFFLSWCIKLANFITYVWSLDVDDEDQPSGITIYTDREIADQEDGEIMEADASKPKRKKTVKFPGINAPIPDNADEKLLEI